MPADYSFVIKALTMGLVPVAANPPRGNRPSILAFLPSDYNRHPPRGVRTGNRGVRSNEPGRAS